MSAKDSFIKVKSQETKDDYSPPFLSQLMKYLPNGAPDAFDNFST